MFGKTAETEEHGRQREVLKEHPNNTSFCVCVVFAFVCYTSMFRCLACHFNQTVHWLDWLAHKLLGSSCLHPSPSQH